MMQQAREWEAREQERAEVAMEMQVQGDWYGPTNIEQRPAIATQGISLDTPAAGSTLLLLADRMESLRDSPLGFRASDDEVRAVRLAAEIIEHETQRMAMLTGIANKFLAAQIPPAP
jgi:hypothetical protein